MRRRKMKKILLILILSSAVILSFMSAVQAQDKDTFVMGIEDEVSDLDPGFTTISVNERVASLIFDGLVEYGENNRIVPGIAQDWTISEDGKEYTFNLRKGVKFHDSSELTA